MVTGNSINNIYSHPIFASILKNDATLYGSFIRSIIFGGMEINDYISNPNINIVKCYSKFVFKDIIERDLNKYIIKKTKPTDLLLAETSRSEYILYTMKYNDTEFILEISYIKNNNMDHYLTYNKAELNIVVDVDCVSLDRKSLSIICLNSLYDREPIPMSRISTNITNKMFKIILDTDLIYNKDSYDYIMNLKSSGWKNIEQTNINFDTDFHMDSECDICSEQHNDTTIKLECGHLFHKECIMTYINNFVKDEHYISRKLGCPYCTTDINVCLLL